MLCKPTKGTGGGAGATAQANGRVRAYAINLPRSTDRRAHMARQLERVGMAWEFVAGVDAREVDLDQPSFVTSEAKAHPLFRPGKVGCALSHCRVYERVLSSGDTVAVVLEDDAVLPADFTLLVEAVAAEMHGAEVTLLNFRHPDGAQLSPEGATEVAGSRVLATPLSVEDLTSGAAYLVTRQACENLAGAMVPMRFSSDEWWRFVAEGALDQVRCVAPMPVVQSLEFRTTIDHYPQGSMQWRFREVSSRLGVPRLPLLRTLVQRNRRRNFGTWGALGDFQLVGNGPAQGPETAPIIPETAPTITDGAQQLGSGCATSSPEPSAHHRRGSSLGVAIRALARDAGLRGRGRALDWLSTNGVLVTRSQGYRLVHLSAARSVEVVVDVGARWGEFGRGMRANGYGGRIVSFEPVTGNFTRLSRRCDRDPLWECHQLALGSAPGRMDIQVTKDSAFSTFRPVSEFGRERYAGMVDVLKTEQVKVARLDEVWPEISRDARAVLLKLDTQGWDLEVLEGCGTVLDQVEVVQIEVTFRAIYEGSPLWTEAIGVLEGRGFALAHLFPVASQPDHELIEADCVLVRSRG